VLLLTICFSISTEYKTYQEPGRDLDQCHAMHWHNLLEAFL
jgi:hypothetical protein